MLEGAHGICDELPDGKAAKPYPLDQVYENIEAASTPATTSSANLSTYQAARLNKIWNAMIFIAVSICSVWI